MLKTVNRIKLITLIFLIFMAPFISLTFSENSRSSVTQLEEYHNKKTPKTSGFWTVNGNTIIDESIPTLNWANTTINYGWCSGSGTWNDPYIIENVTFDAQNSDSALEIKNSIVFYIIRNSTFRNSGGDYHPGYDAGLKLTNTNNGFISNNTMEYNNGYHLYMKNCDNNTITENYFYWSDYVGLYILNSNNNGFKNNTIILSGKDDFSSLNRGIGIYGSDFNQIEGNFISQSIGHAIYLYSSSNDNLIFGNTIYNNNADGVQLDNGPYRNVITKNNISNNDGYGVIISRSDYNTVKDNSLINNSKSGVSLSYADYNLISKNNASENSEHGIELYRSDNSIIKENVANLNEYNPGGSGVSLYESFNNLVTENIVNENFQHGISISFSQNNTINENHASNNGENGIYILFSELNTINNNLIDSHSINGLYIYLSDNNSLVKNYLDSNTNGVNLKESDFNQILKNNITNSGTRGITLDGAITSSDSNQFYKNTFIGNTLHAVDNGNNNEWNNTYVGNSWDNHSTVDTNRDGIDDNIYTYISGSAGSVDYFPVYGSLYYDGTPIMIDGDGVSTAPWINWTWASTRIWCDGLGTLTNPYVIEDININGTGKSYGLYITNSSTYFNILSGTFHSTEKAGNSGGGIRLVNTINGKIIRNNLSNNMNAGIELLSSSDIEIVENVFFNNSKGIYAHTSPTSNITISYNIAYDNVDGFHVVGSSFDTITENKIFNNTNNGIYLSIVDSFITENEVYFNLNNGIYMQGFDCTFSENKIYNNSNSGIEISGSSNIIMSNDINNNSLSGVFLKVGSINNKIHNNSFVKNFVNGYDNGTNNKWYEGIIGNFWADYPYQDANDDNIGDIPYNISGIAGTKDFYPQWWDGDDIPIITILTPGAKELFGKDAPNYEVSIFAADVDQVWYSLTNGSTTLDVLNITNFNTFIDQTSWDTFGNGTITIKFSINDTAGNIGFEEIVVEKDIIAPVIVINSPLFNETFGESPPTISVIVNETNLDSLWFSVDGGLTNISINSVGIDFILDQSVWDMLPNGTITIRFYANDTVGNFGYNEILINKEADEGDLDSPSIILNYPLEGAIFGVDAPTFNLTIYDLSLNKGWFTIGNNATKYFFSVLNGVNLITLSQVVWETLTEGDIVINFYVNDTTGNTNSLTVTINKDLPSGRGGIPFGNSFLLITGITAALLIIIVRRKKIRLK